MNAVVPGGDEEIHHTLYGDPAGHYVTLFSPNGLIPPPTIVVHIPLDQSYTLTCLGNAGERLVGLYYDLTRRDDLPRGGPNPQSKIQQVIADMLGVGQQSVSRYVREETEPKLSISGYSALVRICFNPNLVIDEIKRRRAEEIAQRETGREKAKQ